MIRFFLAFRAARHVAAVICVSLVAVAPLSAQSLYSKADSSAAKAPKQTKGWGTAVESKAAVQYDDNVFLLSPRQKSSLGSSVSGRYAGMESANDMLGVGKIAIQMSGPGVRGRALEITPELSYEFASRNQLRREAAGGVSIAQSLGGGRRIRLKAGSTPSHFARNYMSDAVDADANGSISPAERMYKRGKYGEYSVDGDLRLPLGAKSVVLGVGGGYYARAYDAPFAVRDFSGPTAAISLDFGQKSAVGMELTYNLAALSAAPGPQVVLLDERVYNVDFNSNGRATDSSARAVVDIDRSHLEHLIGTALTFDTGPRVAVSVGYDYRIRSFRSTRPYDETNAGRRDNRSGIRGSLRAKLAKGVYLSTGAKFLTQSTNRPLGSAIGEEADYRNIVASAGFQASF